MEHKQHEHDLGTTAAKHSGMSKHAEAGVAQDDHGGDHGGEHGGEHGVKHSPYIGLLVSVAVSYAAMYLIMYAMADSWRNVYFNLSNVYMTGLMAGSMVPIMLLTMPGMFKNKRLNAAAWTAGAVLLALSWFGLRTEAGVGDRQFLRAMIPHHSAAIQMAQESAITDPRVKKLAEEIISSQEREISQMKALLAEKK